MNITLSVQSMHILFSGSFLSSLRTDAESVILSKIDIDIYYYKQLQSST